MTDDQRFEMFHIEELTSSALFISQQEFGWSMNLAMNSFPSIEFLHQSTKKVEDKTSVQDFDGNPELLTLYDAAQDPLESANIHSSNSGAIETSSSTLTGYLSSIEEPLEEVPVKKKVEAVIENKKSKRKTKRYKSEKMTSKKKINYILNISIHIYEFIDNSFPARNVPVPLSYWWIDNILQSALEEAERGKMWPCDFNSKEYIRASRTPKGRAYKQLGGNDQKWYYVVVYYRYQLHGEEGREVGLTAWRRTTSSTTSTKKIFEREDIAMLQNNDWISGVAGSDKSKIKKVAAEFQELKTDDCMTEANDKDNTSLDSSKKTFKRGIENRESNSGSSVSTSSEERPWKKAKGI